MEAVTAILVDRERASRGLSPMVACSTALHVLAVLIVVFGPGRWLGGAASTVPKIVMNVSLGGGAGGGPENGGANRLGGRPVQMAVKTPEAKPEPLHTPAAKTPEMTVPVPSPKTPARSKPSRESKEPPLADVKHAPEGAHGRIPVTGPEERFGESFAETGATGLGMGLSTGGGGGGSLDVGNFCCPDYLRTMTRRISENWNQRQGVAGIVVMHYTIQRDGRITDIGTEQSGGYVLDLAAQRALLAVRQLPQLPAAYTYPRLTVYLKFEYQR